MLFLGARYDVRRWKAAPMKSMPLVCIQCPCYNEPLVIEGLLDAVASIEWDGPLEIQILDDSNDDTTRLIHDWMMRNPDRAAKMSHIVREQRSGYKAGALAEGMLRTSAEFIAIFDADFRPRPDFLQRLMPSFGKPDVAVAQARWGFSNRYNTILTFIQGAILDVHFVLEQSGRAWGGLFLNFNGTAGIWRRSALIDGGGWSADTVTEDLDLSYRVQAKGWKIVYLSDYFVMSELPETLVAFKSQQRRWTKGVIQVARRQLVPLMCEAGLSKRVRAEIASHLTGGFMQPFIMSFCLIWVLVMLSGFVLPWHGWLALLTAIGVPSLSFLSGQLFRPEANARDVARVTLMLPVLVLFAWALSLSYTVALLEGLISKTAGEFVRTPKGRAGTQRAGLLKSLSGKSMLVATAVSEVGLACLFLVIGFWAVGTFSTGLIVAIGVAFGTVGFLTLRELFTA